MKIWQGIVTAILTLFIGGLGGYGFSQQTVAREVARDIGAIQSVTTATETRMASLEKQFESERRQTDARIFQVAELARDVIKSNVELTQLVRVQNELLKAAIKP